MPHPPYDTWDIVKVPFPFTEGIGGKRRPALIISTTHLAKKHKFYWLLMITSVVRPSWQGDVPIKDLTRSGLPIASVIRTAKITTLQEDKILGRLGSLDLPERKAVKAALKEWMAK